MPTILCKMEMVVITLFSLLLIGNYVSGYNIENVCNVAPEDRTDCGYAGIGEAGCSQRGCCYDNSIPDTFWCFFKTGDELTQKLTKK